MEIYTSPVKLYTGLSSKRRISHENPGDCRNKVRKSSSVSFVLESLTDVGCGSLGFEIKDELQQVMEIFL